MGMVYSLFEVPLQGLGPTDTAKALSLHGGDETFAAWCLAKGFDRV